MKVHASAGNKSRRSFLDHCERLQFRAESRQQAQWLAELCRVMLDGGTLAIQAKGRDRMEVEIDGLDAPDSAPPLPTPGA